MALECITLNLRGEQLTLHPYRAIYWQKHKALLLADLHLGKGAHFRKEGIPMPVQAGQVDFDKLIALLLDFQPERTLFLGDLFHSVYNPTWEEFGQLVNQFGDIHFELIAGNHDILSPHQYEKFQVEVHAEPYPMGPFLLSHHPMESVPEDRYNLAGHIHPGIRLSGLGRQRLRLPCFWFGKEQGLLPAFGSLTGTAPIEALAEDQVFVVTDEAVIEV
jgi:DNA ligase-associated metallophosphoesterase